MTTPKQCVRRRWASTACWPALLAVAGWLAPAQAVTLRPGGDAGVVFGAEYFGMHIHHARDVPWPALPFGTLRLWDAGIRWDKLEPVRGQYDFDELDKLLQQAKDHGKQVILPLAMTPRWASLRPTERSSYAAGGSAPPAQVADWGDFVNAVVQHTQGRVMAYEMWNEANFGQFYSGDIDTLVEMTRLLRAAIDRYAPGAKLVGPSGTGLLDKRRDFERDFIAHGGARYIDVLSFHLYTDPHPPEVMVDAVTELVGEARALKPRPLPFWDTETGYLVHEIPTTQVGAAGPPTPERAAAYLVRAHLIARAAGAELFTAYAWDNNNYAFLTPDKSAPNAVGTAYAAMLKLLIGTRLRQCDIDRGAISSCDLNSPSLGDFKLVWNAGRDAVSWTPGGPVRVTTLGGARLADRATSVTLSEMPVIVQPGSQ